MVEATIRAEFSTVSMGFTLSQGEKINKQESRNSISEEVRTRGGVWWR